MISGVLLAAQSANAEWITSADQSPIDDSPSAYAQVLAEADHIDRYRRAHRFSLQIACEQNTTYVAITFDRLFMSDIQGYGRVTYRVDNHPAHTRDFTALNDNSGLGLLRGQAIPFIKELFGGKRLYISALPFSEAAVEAHFPIIGIDTAVSEIRDACHW